MKRISGEEYLANLQEAVRMTMPIENIMLVENWYLTVEEMNCIHSIAVNMDEYKINDYIEILKKYCENVLENSNISRRLGIHELVFTSVADYYGTLGLVKDSNEIGNAIIKCCLENRRMRTLARNLYSNCWNIYKVGNGDSLTRDDEVITTLHRCILLSDIMDNEVLKRFFVKMSQD